MKIFVFVNEQAREHFAGVAIAEDGKVLAQHLSSSESWCMHDMGMFPNNCDWKHDKYKAHCPDGYELEFIKYDDVVAHKELQEAFKKHALTTNPQEEI